MTFDISASEPATFLFSEFHCLVDVRVSHGPGGGDGSGVGRAFEIVWSKLCTSQWDPRVSARVVCFTVVSGCERWDWCVGCRVYVVFGFNVWWMGLVCRVYSGGVCSVLVRCVVDEFGVGSLVFVCTA